MISFYKIVTTLIIIFSCSYFLAIFWHIYVADIENWQNVQLYDVFVANTTFYTDPDYNFLDENMESSSSNFEQLVTMCYFAITTLSTIGFGDYSPKSVQEKAIFGFILLLGVAIFSIIVNKLMDILRDYKSIDQFGKHKDLSKWIALLSKFNGGNPLNKKLIDKIEDFFQYYW